MVHFRSVPISYGRHIDGVWAKSSPVRLVMVEKERGDLFAVIQSRRTLLVQVNEPLCDYEGRSNADFFPGCDGHIWKTQDGKRYLSVDERGPTLSTVTTVNRSSS